MPKETKSLKEMRAQEETDGLDEVDRINVGGTFKLVDIEGTIDLAENTGLYFNQIHNSKLDVLLKRTEETKKIAASTGNQAAILEAALDDIVGQWEARTDLVNLATCLAQLFNQEKAFGFFEQDCRHIRHRAEGCAGGFVENDPPTLRQLFREPMKLGVQTKEREAKERKKRDISAILRDSGRLSKLAVKDAESVNKQISEQEAQVPPLPAKLTYDGVGIPTAIPQEVRQSVYDLVFTCNQIHAMRVELMRLREAIGGTLLTWVNTSKEAWEYGTEHIHEFPDLRKYEYTRVALQASYLVAYREEYKLFTYFNSDTTSKGLCAPLEAAFSKAENIEKINLEWDQRTEKVMNAFSSIEDMVRRIDSLNKTLNEDADKTENTGNEWWKHLQRLP